MALATVARYTGSALDATIGLALLAVAALHAIAGVPTSVLPAIGGLVLLGAAVALAPATRKYVRRNGRPRGDVAVFVGGLVVAAVSLGAFVALGISL